MKGKWWLALWLGMAWLFPTPLPARTSFNSELLAPTTDNGPYLHTYSTRTLGQYKFSIGGTFDIAHRPIELAGATGGRLTGLIEDLFVIHVLGSFGILDWFQIGLDLPVVPVDRVIDATTGADRIRFRMGDIRFDMKFRILDPDRYGWGIAAIPFANIPSGNGNNLVGNNSFAGGVKLAFETPDLANRVRAAINVGYQIRKSTTLFTTEVDDFFLYSFAVNFRVTDYFEIIPELFGQSVAKNLFKDADQSPMELGATARVHLMDRLSLDLGGSAGIVAGVGAPVWRALARIAYNPLRRAPLVPKKKVGPRIPLTEAEIYELTKNCPPPADYDPAQHDSACEKIYELRQIRNCPAPEDFDPAVHDESCEKIFVLQQYDNDQDGVPDYMDRCPDDRGPVENDGCPTHGVVTIDWNEGKIKTDKFLFEFGKHDLVSQTRGVLDRVAAELKPKLDYVNKLIIEGHTDSVGRREYNDWLSKQRAQAVYNYLKGRGVPTSKMRMKGYGQERPVVSNQTEAGQRQNRRVEIMLDLPHRARSGRGYRPVQRSVAPAAEPVSVAPSSAATSVAPPSVPGAPRIAAEAPILDPGLSVAGEDTITKEVPAKRRSRRR